jgi:mono/diheme cytochrome c family protein
MPSARRVVLGLLLLALSTAVWIGGIGMARAAPRAEPLPGDYRIEAGRVDRGTFTGWRLFHSSCHGCHGVDARGTDLAPNLVQQVRQLTPRAFASVVLTRYRLVPPAGAADDREAALQDLIDQVMRRDRDGPGAVSMPAWDDHPQVKAHVLDLYAYLSARADGQLGPGRPRPMAHKQR